MDPKIVRILQALYDQLLTMLVANGYYNNMGQNVARGLSSGSLEQMIVNGARDPEFAMCAIGDPYDVARASDSVNTEDYHGTYVMQATIGVAGAHATVDQNNMFPEKARIVADIKRALLQFNDMTYRKLLHSIAPLNDDYIDDNESTKICHAGCEFLIIYSEQFGDPTQ